MGIQEILILLPFVSYQNVLKIIARELFHIAIVLFAGVRKGSFSTFCMQDIIFLTIF